MAKTITPDMGAEKISDRMKKGACRRREYSYDHPVNKLSNLKDNFVSFCYCKQFLRMISLK